VAEVLGGMLAKWQGDLTNKHTFLEWTIMQAARTTSLDHAWATSPDNKPLWNATGYANDMVAVGCGKQCAWESHSGLTMDDLHFTIELATLPPMDLRCEKHHGSRLLGGGKAEGVGAAPRIFLAEIWDA